MSSSALTVLNKNVNNEIRKGKNIYFRDSGIRKAVLANLQSKYFRTDLGALWENFVTSKRLKNNRYAESDANTYFGRTTLQQEIDFIEEAAGANHLFEFKCATK